MKNIKSNKGITNMTLITIVLVIIILMLAGAVVYLVKNPNTTYITQNVPTEQAKLSSTVEENGKETVNDNIEVSNNTISNTVENENKYEKIKGTYTYRTNHPEETEIICDYQLYLKEDGTFNYVIAIDNHGGFCGNYIINENEIILNKLFGYGSDVGIGVENGQVKLKINEDGTISDLNKYEYSPINSVVLNKKTNSVEKTETLKAYINNAIKYDAIFGENE